MSVKISELPSLETLADNDILAGVDTSEDTTSKITLEKIKNYATEDVYEKEEVDETVQELQTQIDSLSTIYNAFPTASDEGESMTLDDTAEVTFKKLDLKGNTSQDGTPTPASPIPVNVVSGDNTINITGKQLFQSEYILAPSSVPKAELKAGTYTIATCDGNGFGANVYFRLLDMNNNLVNENGHLTSTNTQINFSTSSYYYLGGAANSYITFTIDNDYKIGIGLLSADGTRQVMLVKGSEAVRTYEPYIGNTYPIYLGVENLFDKDNANVLNAYLSGYTITGYASNQTIYVPIEGGKTYTISKNVGVRNLSIAYTTTTPTIGGSTLGTIDANAKTYTTTAPSNATYLCVFVRGDSDSSYTLEQILNGLEIGKGHVSSTPIELCKIGTYQDYIYKDNGSWYLHKEIGKHTILANDINQFQNVLTNSKEARIRCTTIGCLVGYEGIYYTNRFSNVSNTWGIDQVGIMSPAGTGKIDISLRIPANSEKSWFTTNETILYFPLATPTNTLIEDTTLIEQLEELKLATSYEGQTNIIQENNDLPFILDVEAIKKLS